MLVADAFPPRLNQGAIRGQAAARAGCTHGGLQGGKHGTRLDSMLGQQALSPEQLALLCACQTCTLQRLAQNTHPSFS